MLLHFMKTVQAGPSLVRMFPKQAPFYTLQGAFCGDSSP